MHLEAQRVRYVQVDGPQTEKSQEGDNRISNGQQSAGVNDVAGRQCLHEYVRYVAIAM